MVTAATKRARDTATLWASSAGSTPDRAAAGAAWTDWTRWRRPPAGRAGSGPPMAAAVAEPTSAVLVAVTSSPEAIARARPFMRYSFHSAKPPSGPKRARVDAGMGWEGAKAAQRMRRGFRDSQSTAGVRPGPTFLPESASTRT